MHSQSFGERIKAARRNLDYSLQYVGNEISYGPRSLSKVEKGKLTAPDRIIEPLARVLKLNFRELFAKYLSETIYYQIRSSEFAEEALKIALRRLKREGQGTQEVKSRDDILQSIKTYFKSKPVENVWIFGSFALENGLKYDSDIDIMIEFKKHNRITLLDIIEMKEDLFQETGRSIDLVEKGQVVAGLAESINRNKILIYGR